MLWDPAAPPMLAGRRQPRRRSMRAMHIVGALAFAASLGMAATATDAQDSMYVPLLTYRTGPFAGSGIPIANGLHDYLSMLNERDGGVGGVKLNVEECETVYDTKKGVECYEAVKGKGPVIMSPWSTGITLQLIPKASVDKIPILSLGYGLSASAVGDDFPWIFNPPATYWDGLSMIFKYIGGKEGGLEKLKGKTVGFIFFEGGYGREPIPLLEQFAKDYGFEVKMYPVTVQEMQNQSAQWLGVRRDRSAATPRDISPSISIASALTIRRSETSSNTSSIKATARSPRRKSARTFTTAASTI